MVKTEDKIPTTRSRTRGQKKVAKKTVTSAGQLFERLGAAATSTHVFTGLIKRADNDEESIMFALEGNCSRWIKIPTDKVADIKLLHMSYCDGHTHPLVQLFMQEPRSSDAIIFAQLAELYSASISTRPTFVEPSMGEMMRRVPGSTPCYWDWARSRWIC